jgi:hypothetical protein
MLNDYASCCVVCSSWHTALLLLLSPPIIVLLEDDDRQHPMSLAVCLLHMRCWHRIPNLRQPTWLNTARWVAHPHNQLLRQDEQVGRAIQPLHRQPLDLYLCSQQLGDGNCHMLDWVQYGRISVHFQSHHLPAI